MKSITINISDEVYSYFCEQANPQCLTAKQLIQGLLSKIAGETPKNKRLETAVEKIEQIESAEQSSLDYVGIELLNKEI